MNVKLQDLKSAGVIVTKKLNKHARNNNITAEISKKISRTEKRVISSDTGYQTLGEVMGRTMTYSKKNNSTDSIKRIVNSAYTKEGKLSQRILSNQYSNNVRLQQRKINVNYNPDGTNTVTVRFQPTNSYKAKKVIQKGKPTITSYIENLGTPFCPIIKKTKIINYAHLNKSEFKSIQTITDIYASESSFHTDIIKQDIKFKDGSQIIKLMNRHNPVITHLENGRIKDIYIGQQKIKDFINTLDKEVQDILRA